VCEADKSCPLPPPNSLTRNPDTPEARIAYLENTLRALHANVRRLQEELRIEEALIAQALGLPPARPAQTRPKRSAQKPAGQAALPEAAPEGTLVDPQPETGHERPPGDDPG